MKLNNDNRFDIDLEYGQTLKGELIMTLVFPVAVLKRYIKKHKPRVVRGGDDNTSKLYLINLADLVTIIE